MTTHQDGLFVESGQGRSYYFGEDLYTFKAIGEETGGTYTFSEIVIAPQGGAPLHRHSQEDESFYIQEGELEFQLNDRKITATAGTFLYAPKGHSHGFTNTTTNPVKLLVWDNPSGFEKFIAEVGKSVNTQVTSGEPLSSEDFDKILTAAPKYGIEIIPPQAES